MHYFSEFLDNCALGSSLTLLDINKSLCIEKIHSRVIGNNVCANRLSYINVLKICSSATDFFRALGPKIVKILYRIIKWITYNFVSWITYNFVSIQIRKCKNLVHIQRIWLLHAITQHSLTFVCFSKKFSCIQRY